MAGTVAMLMASLLTWQLLGACHCKVTFEDHMDRLRHLAASSGGSEMWQRHARYMDQHGISLGSLLLALHSELERSRREGKSVDEVVHLFLDSSTGSKLFFDKLHEAGDAGRNVSRVDDQQLRYTGVHAGSDTTTRNPDPLTDGKQCLIDILVYAAAVKLYAQWALTMLDASGRPGPGLFTGRALWLGDFDECINVRASYPVSKNETRNFQGRYCSASYTVNISALHIEFSSVQWGLCLPDSCEGQDATNALNIALQMLMKNTTDLVFTSTICHEPMDWPPRAIGVMALVGLFVVLVLAATVTDLLVIQWPRWRQEAIDSALDDDVTAVSESMQGIELDHDDLRAMIVNREEPVRQIVPGLPLRLLLAFSAWTNGVKLFNTRQPKGTLKCLNGIRVISMTWVILGHTIVVNESFTENLLDAYKTHISRWTFQAIANATVSVDSFFLLSGLLVAYLSLKELARTGGRINWALFYVHRYLRLTPIYMVCLGIWAVALPYWFDGPMVSQDGYELNHCEDSWWGNLLYVQNLVDFKQPCFAWAWYLAVDMQFYVLSPLIFVPLYFIPVLGYITLGIFFLATTIPPYVITLNQYFPPSVVPTVKGHTAHGDGFHDMYTAPYCRMGPYLVGMALGYVLYRTRCRVRIPKVLNLLGWAAATALALAVLYGLFDYARGARQIDLQLAAVYNALSRTAWSVCVAWVIFSCVTGHGGLVDSLLSLPVWVPLSRLTYAVYLIHPIIFVISSSSRRTPFFLNDMSLVTTFLAALMACYSVAVLVSLTLEWPVGALEKVLLKKEKRS